MIDVSEQELQRAIALVRDRVEAAEAVGRKRIRITTVRHEVIGNVLRVVAVPERKGRAFVVELALGRAGGSVAKSTS